MKYLLFFLSLFALFSVNAQVKITSGMPDTTGANKGRVLYTSDFYGFMYPLINGGSAYASTIESRFSSFQNSYVLNTALANYVQQSSFTALQTLVAGKADSNFAYSKGQVDGLLFGKTNTVTTAGLTNRMNTVEGWGNHASAGYALQSGLNAANTAITALQNAGYITASQLSSATASLLPTSTAAATYTTSPMLTAAVSPKVNYGDTAAMLQPYAKSVNTVSQSYVLSNFLKITDTAGLVAPYAKRIHTPSFPTRLLNTAYTISTAYDTYVYYTFSIAATASLTGAQVVSVYLEISLNGSTWTSIGQIINPNLLGLSLLSTTVDQIAGYIPAGYQVRLRTVNANTGTITGNATVSMIATEEVQN